MVYVQPTISKAGVEYAKWIHRRYVLFVMRNICTMNTGTTISSLEVIFQQHVDETH